MGKAFVFGMVGLISIGLLIGFGFAIKLLVLTFMGRRKKNEKVSYHSECAACRSGAGPYGVHEHH